MKRFQVFSNMIIFKYYRVRARPAIARGRRGLYSITRGTAIMPINTLAAGVLAILVFTAFSAVAGGQRTQALQGIASYYGGRFHGRKTASGERFNQNAMTAAHKTLPLGTKVRVTNLRNGETVDVKINDRGPYIKGRIIDLSKGAARRLGMIRSGTAKVRLEVVSESGGGA
jgi:rare lipoprotein A